MEFGLKEWSIILGVVILLALAADGFRRSLREKRSELRMSSNLSKGIGRRDPIDDISDELPRGGARVVGRESSIDTHSSALGAYEDEVPTLVERVEVEEEAEVEVAAEPLKPGHNLEVTDEVIMICVKAQDGQEFAGHKLVECLVASGANYGAKQIFHAHHNRDINAPVSFSVVNMKEPGHFDLDTLDAFDTPGVMLFMGLPHTHGVDALHSMVEAANCVAERLEGTVFDRDMSVFNAQTLKHYEERIQTMELEKLGAGQEA